MDARRLGMIPSTSVDEKDGERPSSNEERLLVQMDSIPEDVVVVTEYLEGITQAKRQKRINFFQWKENIFTDPIQRQNTISNRMKLISTHIAQWFNTLDYDGDYLSTVPYPESIGSLVLQYIDALASGIIISACLEYNDHTTEFQDYCQHLCDIAFYLAYSEVEAMEPEQKTSLQIEDYCAKVAQDLLQTVFLSVARKKLEMETIQATADSSHNEALSHNSVYELEERLGRISEDDENESGSTSSDEEDRHGYELLNLVKDDQANLSSIPLTNGNVAQNEKSDSEQSFISIQDAPQPKVQIVVRPPTPPERPPQPKRNTDEVDNNTMKTGNHRLPDEVVLANQAMMKHVVMEEHPLTQEELDHIAWIQQLAAQSSFEKPVRPTPPAFAVEDVEEEQHSSATSGADDEQLSQQSSFDQQVSFEQFHDYGKSSPLHEPTAEEREESTLPEAVVSAEQAVIKHVEMEEHPLTQEELDHIAWIQQLASQSSFDKPVRPTPPPFAVEDVEEEQHSSATSGADDEQLSQQSSFDQQVSFEQFHDYSKTSPLLKPTAEESEEPTLPEEVVSAEQAVIKHVEMEEHLLTQEELDHIAWIQQLASQSSFDKPVKPTPPPFAVEDVEEEQHSSATSGADDEQLSQQSSFDQQVSFEQFHDYGKSSPLLEPTAEESEEPTLPQKVVLAKQAVVKHVEMEEHPLTQEELDHIAWIQQLASQSSFDKPVRPTPPPFAVEDVEEEQHSSATSGADDEQLSQQSSFDQQVSFEQFHDYSKTSPLLKPTAEESEEPTLPEEVVSAEQAVIKHVEMEEHLLTQEELDHIAWIQQLASQSSFDKPVKPTPPPFAVEDVEEEQHSSATSGADDEQLSQQSSFDQQVSFEQFHDYGKSSPLLEPTAEESEEPTLPQKVVLAKQAVVKHVEMEEHPLTQEELDHIAWIQQRAAQSSFEKPVRPTPPPFAVEDVEVEPTPPAFAVEDVEEEQHSSATSGADDEQLSQQSSFDKQVSFEQFHDYGKSSPLLEPTAEESEEPTLPQKVVLAKQAVVKHVEMEEHPLTQEELDHIAWIQQLASQSSFEKPVRPTPPAFAVEDAEGEQHSSATSGADDEQLSQQSSFDKQVSFEQFHDYSKTSPLLEPTAEESEEPTLPQKVVLAKQAVVKHVEMEEHPLTQEELDHIAWIQQLASQSSFEKPVRPTPPAFAVEDAEGEQHSSATSGADDEQLSQQSSFDQQVSFEQFHDYSKTSPLLEPTAEERAESTWPEEVVSAEQAVRNHVETEEHPLTQEELDHIAWIQQLAAQCSFEKPVRPTPPAFSVEDVEEEQHSSATSGADDEQLSQQSSFDQQVSFEQFHDYGKSSPLLEPTAEESEEPTLPEEVVLAEQAVVKHVETEEHPLTQEELDHIAWIQQLAAQCSFEKPVRPTPPAFSVEDVEEKQHSSATSGADDEQLSQQSSFDQQVSFEQFHDYSKTSPLLEPTAEESEEPTLPQKVVLAKQTMIKHVEMEEHLLTQEELDHIAWIQQLASQSSFDKPVRPTPPPFAVEDVEEEQHSSATSGADDEQLSQQSSFDQQVSFEQFHDYGKSSQLHEPTAEEREESTLPEAVVSAEQAVIKHVEMEEHPLTQEELDHIAWIQQLAAQSSFEKPVRPIPPAFAVEDVEEEQHSSATSGADDENLSQKSSFDQQVSFERFHDYGKSSPLLEPTAEESEEPTLPEEVVLAEQAVVKHVIMEEHPLTQEELDHIAWIQQLAAQSSFEKPVRPTPPAFAAENVEEEPAPPAFAVEDVEEEQHSSATSGADDEQLSQQSSFDQQVSFEQFHDYGKSSPLLEPTAEESEEPTLPEEVVLAEQAVVKHVIMEEHPLTQEELDHIAWIQQLAAQSSFEKPVRPIPPAFAVEDLEEEQHSRATSGADDENLSQKSSFDQQVSFEQFHDYSKTSPLLEPTAEERAESTWPEEVVSAEQAVIKHVEMEEHPLTQEELDHIAWIQQLAAQCSFEKPVRPTPPAFSVEDVEEEQHSSATSGADDEQLSQQSSFDQQVSFEQFHDYSKTSPLLEPTAEESEEPTLPQKVVLAKQTMIKHVEMEEHLLTQEELDHIAWIQQLASQSSFDKPVRPTPPPFAVEDVEEEQHSSATSGADDEQLSQQSSFDQQVSFEQFHDYGKSSQLHEPTAEEREESTLPEAVVSAEQAVIKHVEMEEHPLTQEELDHIAWIQQLAAQSSFEKPVRPIPPAFAVEDLEEEQHSSATSGADDENLSQKSSFDQQVSFERFHDYGKSSPLLEPTAEESEEPTLPEEVVLAEQAVVKHVIMEEHPLTQEELDHIAWIQQLAAQSSFEKPVRPTPPAFAVEDAEEEQHSSATSGADDEQLSQQFSFDQQVSYEQFHDYSKTSPFLEPTAEESEEPTLPEEVVLAEQAVVKHVIMEEHFLTQEELDHIAWIQQLAAQSSFEKPVRPTPPAFAVVDAEEEQHSSATSGADDAQLSQQSSFDQQVSFEQFHDYGKSSPLLEPTAEESEEPTLPEEVVLAEQAVVKHVIMEEHPLTQEELDHIAWIQQLAAQSSFEKPVRPTPPAFAAENVEEEPAPPAFAVEDAEEEQHSSATSGADDEQLSQQSSFDQQVSFEQFHDYSKTSPLLEPTAEESEEPTLPQKVVLAKQTMIKHVEMEELLLTQEELDRIAWIQQLASQSSFDKPVRPTPPAFAVEDAEEEQHSSATSGADDAQLSQQSSFDQQVSYEQFHDYGKSLPLLEPTAEESEEPTLPQKVVLAKQTMIKHVEMEEHLLTQEELDHIAWIQQLAAQSSFEKPVRPTPPAFAVEDAEEEQHSSATSGADDAQLSQQSSFDQQVSFEQFHDYSKTSPLLEPTAEESEEPTLPEEVVLAEQAVVKHVIMEEHPLTQEELDHIAWIQQLAAQSSFEKPVRPIPPAFAVEDLEEEQHSSATSGADDENLSQKSSFDQQVSFEQFHDYSKTSPLLEPTAEERAESTWPEEVVSAEQAVVKHVIMEEHPLTQEELDHIAWIQQLAAQSSFEKPVRPIPPASAVEDLEEEQHSSATSGADDENLSQKSSFDQQVSFERFHDYGKSSPLLEPTAEESEEPTLPEEVVSAEQAVIKHVETEEHPLTQEELDHIAWIQQLAAQSSFEKPVRPTPPAFAAENVEEEPAPPAFAVEDVEEEQHSSATSGADDEQLSQQSSFDQQVSFEQFHDYGKSSPLLEPTAEESEEPTLPEEVVLAEQAVVKHVIMEEHPLTQEELDHIAWIQQLAAQSSFEKPVRPTPPAFAVEDAEEEQHSSATSGADDENLSQKSSFDQQVSFERFHDYGKSSPLLEPTAEESEEPTLPEEVVSAEQAVIKHVETEEHPLTQEELDHIAWIQQLAAQSSFEKPVRPTPPAFAAENVEEEPAPPAFAVEDVEEEQHSSATSGADDEQLSQQSSFDQQVSFEQFHDYGKSSPLLEPTAEESEEPTLPEEVVLAEQAVVKHVIMEEHPLTQEELDHIAWIQQLAAQSSFEKPVRPTPPAFAVEDAEEEQHSSATSGADDENLSQKSSFDQQVSFERFHDYGKSSPLLEPTAEESEEPTLPEEVVSAEQAVIKHVETEEHPLTQEELDHIAWIQQLAAQSSFEKPVRPTPPAFAVEDAEEEQHSSATSGADDEQLSQQSSFDQQVSFEQFHDYGKSSPLLEPTAEESEEPTLPEEVVSAEQAVIKHVETEEHPLTQEELDHIAWIQQLAAQSSFEKPVRPTPPAFAVEDAEEEQHSSATSGADDEQLSQQFSFDQQVSYEQFHDYSKTSPLLEPTAEERAESTWPEEVVLAEQAVIKHDEADERPVLDSETLLVQRSFSDVRVDGRFVHNTDLRQSLSTSCVSEKCGELHSRLNAFELCEQHSFTQSRDLLCNVDFLCRLNFVAYRMTEDIAETAGSELLSFYHSLDNPRARYFGNHAILDRSVSEESDVDSVRRVSVELAVEPERQISTGGFLGLFSKKNSVERPRSSLSIFYTDRNVRKMSEQQAGRKRSDGSDIINLLRRSSGADSRASNESPMRFPDYAFVGLSKEEKEHVMTVLERSTKTQSPSMSRRSSSALQVLPEMDDITEAERDHIQKVLARANSPYILPKKGVELEGPTVEENVAEDAWMTAEATRRVHRHERQVAVASVERVSPVEHKEHVSVFKTIERFIEKELEPIREEALASGVSSRKSSSSTILTSPNPSSHHKSFFAKARDSVKAATAGIEKNLRSETEDMRKPNLYEQHQFNAEADTNRLQLTEEELDHIRMIEEQAETSTRETNLKADLSSAVILTEEELDHIRKVQQAADMDQMLPLQTPPAHLKTTIPPITENELTTDELEHIRRVQELADKDSAMYSVKSETKKLSTDIPITSIVPNVEKRETSAAQETNDLTMAELKHIPRIQKLPEEDMKHAQQVIIPKTSQRLESVPLESKNVQISSNRTTHADLSAEELDHIKAVQEMADAQLWGPLEVAKKSVPHSVIEQYELSEEELAHTQRIEAAANADSWTSQEEQGITKEELEHIRRVTEMADFNFKTAMPTNYSFTPLTEQEVEKLENTTTPIMTGALTQEELDHIRRITELADQQMMGVYIEKDASPVLEVVDMKTTERKQLDRASSYEAHYPLDIFEEAENIWDSNDATKGDDLLRTNFELTEEELEHIRRVTELSERASIYAEQGTELSSEDLKRFTEQRRSLREETLLKKNLEEYKEEPYDDFEEELTQEEAEQIRRISERDEENLEDELPTYDIPAANYVQHEFDVTFYPECESVSEHTSEGVDSRILDRSSPAAKDGSSESSVGINYGANAHPIHEYSSQVDDEDMSFQIKEVSEMPRDEHLGEWYESQLSFVRESIDQEEELDRTGLLDNSAGEVIPDMLSETRQERGSNDSLDIGSQLPQAPTGNATPYQEQPTESIGKSKISDTASGWLSRIDRPSSSMFKASKPGRFGFSGLGKFAQDAFDKAKKVGEQLQSATDPLREHPNDNESEEERLRREAIEACFHLDAVPSIPPTEQPTASKNVADLLPPGIEHLPIEEQQKILAVLAEAEAQSREGPISTPAPIISTQQTIQPAESKVSSQSRSIEPTDKPWRLEQPPLAPPQPLTGLEELSHEEQERIMAVIAQAESMDRQISQKPITPERITPSTHIPLPSIPPGLEELSQEERERIMAVIANAEMAMDESGSYPVVPQEQSLVNLSKERERAMNIAEDAQAFTQSFEPISETVSTSSDWIEPSSPSFTYQQPYTEVTSTMPRTSQLQFGITATETCIDADLPCFPEEAPQPPPAERRQISMTSSSDSPVRESGYGSASTSYATELGDYAFKPSVLLEEVMDQREGARSRNGSRAEDLADDDFTYSDQRFSELHDDTTFESEQHEDVVEKEEKMERETNWNQRGRMWTTVFEGDEHAKDSRLESSSPTDAIEMDEVYDNIFSDTPTFQEIAFDSTPKPPSDTKAIVFPKEAPKKVEEKVPEVIVTVHEDRRSDSEDEESGSEDDDEYPDKVVAAPVEAPPFFEEVEQERLQQEQFGKEVLQQIQAFGESANDEFDVQWAKTALEGKTFDLMSSGAEPLELTSNVNRKNPFLDSPEEEDVAVDMEELDLQRVYQGHSHVGATHRPVYTIPEDENEPRGTSINSDSKLYAKEKRRMVAHSVADRIIQLSSPALASVPPITTSSDLPSTNISTSHTSLFTSSYLFSTAPFVLPTTSAPLYTTPTMVSPMFMADQQKNDAELNSKIDKTLSDIHDLLDTCAVYTSEKSKPNLLCYSGKLVYQAPTSTSLSLTAPEECTSCSPSPSFLIPLSHSSVNQEKEEEQVTQTGTLGSGLRRSPGMILPSETEKNNLVKERVPVMPWKDVLEDDGPTAGQDMGRRKLPSIPSQSSYSTTTTYPAPPPGAYVIPPSSEPQRIMARVPPAQSYLSSSAPSSSTAGSFTLFGPSAGTQTNGLPAVSLPTERPSSAMSWSSVASTSQFRDPAILPGASFHPKPKIAVRQPVSSIIGRRSAGAKVPNTLARVLLKKELKEALSRRKETLEACEIEANQRQYVVHQMLVTGLLPEGREDDTPNVIPCLLPIELINGARVIPKKTCTVATQKSEEDTRPIFEVYPPKPPQHAKSSIGVQIDDPLLERTRSYNLPSTSLSQQLRSLSTYKRTAETQTDTTTLPFYRETPLDRERLSRSMRHDATAQTTDLLEATRKYFEDYDRKLKELGVRTKKHHHKHHFHFHDDDDSLSREQRKSELSEELARRRERLWTTDPYEIGTDGYHYGSLPRIDRTATSARDFTIRDQAYNPTPYNYGSLPRNYERMMAPAPLEPIQIEYEQSFGARPSYETGYGMSQQPFQARSLFDLNAGYPQYNTFSNLQEPSSYRGKSLNYLDQVADPRTLYRDQDPRRCLSSFAPYQNERPYSHDTTNLNRTGATDLLLSQYATYLQREYQPALLSNESRQPIYRRGYDAPLSDPYRLTEQPRFDPYLQDDRGYGTLPAAMPSLRQRYDAPISDSYAAPSEFAVYSRSERNYGSRPPAYSMDYGNRLQTNVYTRTEPDALSRVYASRRRVAEQPLSQPPYCFRSLENVKTRDPPVTQTSPRNNNTKRLLLTRCYRDHNIYNDLGVRVVGGKRMKDGMLGAFVSAVNQGKYNQTLGEIRPGDQVLEWNGVFLTGKTFEEVERIVNSSSGEVEIVVRTGEPEYSQTGEFDIRTVSPEGKPPVPMHRKQTNRIYDNVDTLSSKRTNESDLGHLQVAAFYDQRMCKLIVKIMSARGLKTRDPIGRTLPNPFVKVYLLPGRKVSHKRRTRFVPCNANPEWNQSVEYSVPSTTLYAHCLELTIWDYDKYENNALGRVIIPLSDTTALSGVPRWYTIEVLDPRTARSVLNAPLERNMTSTQNDIPATLDIGYPAID